MASGFIKLHRQITEWEWYKNIPVRILFEHCLYKTNYETKKWRDIVIERGSFITSYENLAFETGLTVQQIRTALSKLKSTGEITHKTTNHYSIITVNNWEKYQMDNTQNDKQINKQINKQSTTTKEYKNNKKDKNNIYAQFSEFYIAYPKKKSKQAAEKAFNKAISKTSFEKIMEGLEAYKKEIQKKHTEEQYIKYPATWLNQECWDDTYYQEPKYEERPYKAIGNEYNWGDKFDYDNTPYRGYR